MTFNALSVAALILGIIILYIFCLIFIKPIKFIFRLLINIAFGGILIFVYNYLGGLFGIAIGLNPFTSAIAGILGIPGLIAMFFTLIFI